MSNIWIHADFPTDTGRQQIPALVESKTQTLKESSEHERVLSISNVRCECGNRMPWKILADGDGDLSDFANGLHADIGEILQPGSFNVTLNAS